MGLMEMFAGNFDEEQARQLINAMDDEQIAEGMQTAMDEFVVPHLEDVRENAQSTPDRQSVREQYHSMPDAKQQEAFNRAIWDMVSVAGKLRVSPDEGLRDLKTMLRDPWTMEALLLVFHNPNHIDPNYSEEMRETATKFTRLAAMNLIPEAYTESEARDLMAEMGLDENDLEDMVMEAVGNG